jgi:hypothetical protein
MKQRLLLVGVSLTAFVAVGCAITDYEGYSGHQTAAEAKFWAAEISFITGDPSLDGTYAYTAKYDNPAGGHDVNMKIYSYRNPVVSSFSRDGQIDRDGDNVQGRAGIAGGKFLTFWTTTDPATGCQFFDNQIQKHNGAPAIPPIALCDTVEEEIDNDLELQASFASTGDLLSQIWSGALNSGFTMEVTSLTLGGANVPLPEPLSIGAKANGVRPTQLTVDLSGPAGQGLIQAILNNTSDGVPVSLGLNFAGGMSFSLPNQKLVAFDHDALAGLIN